VGGLRFSSLLSEGAEPFQRRICEHLAAELGRAIEFIGGVPWRERAAMLDRGELDAAFVCGWHYASRIAGPAPVQLCAAPVYAAPRYGGEAVYYSDVIVAADSTHRTLSDLRGLRVAYNDRDSHSGYNLLLELVRGDRPFFGEAIESGSHMASIALVRKGGADCAAIDSTVLDHARAQRPELESHLRSAAVLGPSASPPLVMSSATEVAVLESVKGALCGMSQSKRGCGVLGAGQVLRFVRVTPDDYSDILAIGRRAANDRLA